MPSHKDWGYSQSLFFYCYLHKSHLLRRCYKKYKPLYKKNTYESIHARMFSLLLYANFLFLLQFLFSTYLFCDGYSALSQIDGILDVTQKTVGGTIYEYTKFYPVMESNRHTFPLSDYREIFFDSNYLLWNCIKDDVFYRIVITLR